MKRGLLLLALALGVGCATPPAHTLRIHEQVEENLPSDYARRVPLPLSTQVIDINPFPTLSEKDVYNAHLEDTIGGTAVLIQFDAHGLVELSEMTTRMRGRYIVVFVDNRVVAATLVERPIVNGQYLLLGTLSDAEAQALVHSLNKTAGRRRDIGDQQLAP